MPHFAVAPRAAAGAARTTMTARSAAARTGPDLLGTRRQVRVARQEGIDAARRLAAFPDRPHHQRLAAAHVSAGEHPRHARLVVRADADVAALVEAHAELLDHPWAFRTEKAEREQHELALDLELAPRDLDHLRAAVVALLPF